MCKVSYKSGSRILIRACSRRTAKKQCRDMLIDLDTEYYYWYDRREENYPSQKRLREMDLTFGYSLSEVLCQRPHGDSPRVPKVIRCAAGRGNGLPPKLKMIVARALLT